MFKYLDGTDARYWARVKHFYQQVHEDRVLVQTIAIVLLQCRLQILQAVVLLLENLLVSAALHAEYARTEELLACLGLCAALQRHPQRDSCQHLE